MFYICSVTPTTPTRTPADACESFLPKLCNAMEAMKPDYATASLVTLLWWCWAC